MTVFNFPVLDSRAWSSTDIFIVVPVFTACAAIPPLIMAYKTHHRAKPEPQMRLAHHVFLFTLLCWILAIWLNLGNWIDLLLYRKAMVDEYRYYKDVNGHLLYAANWFFNLSQAGLVATIGGLLTGASKISSVPKPSPKIGKFVLGTASVLMTVVATATLIYAEVVYTKHISQALPDEPQEEDFPRDKNAANKDGFKIQNINYTAFYEAHDAWRDIVELPIPHNFGMMTMDAIFDILFFLAAVTAFGLAFIAHRHHLRGASASQGIVGHAKVAASFAFPPALFNFIGQIVFWAAGLDIPPWVPIMASLVVFLPLLAALAVIYTSEQKTKKLAAMSKEAQRHREAGWASESTAA